jgi:hypothetical protein
VGQGCRGLNEEDLKTSCRAGMGSPGVRGRAISREVAGRHDQAWYIWKRSIEEMRVANGKATVPGVGFGSLGRGVMRMPGRCSLGDRPKTA